MAHVDQKECPSLVCDTLVNIRIDDDKCLECGLCIKNCPADSISDDFVVDNDTCTRCNTCIEVCPADAISRVTRGGGNNEQ